MVVIAYGYGLLNTLILFEKTQPIFINLTSLITKSKRVMLTDECLMIENQYTFIS